MIKLTAFLDKWVVWTVIAIAWVMFISDVLLQSARQVW
jgi:low affinity Fe/Cu permease